MNSTGLARRQFLKTVGVVGAGLVIAVPLTSCSSSKPWPGAQAEDFQPNAFLQIADDGHITFFLPSVEMGQGTATGFTTLIAEELDVNPADIEVRHAGVHKDYGALQVTGGSSSIRNFYLPIRQAAADARETLRRAAAQQLKVEESAISFDNGLIHLGQQSFSYGEFVDLAATLSVSTESPLKPGTEYRLIGKEGLQRVDALAKVTGQAEFGIDFEHANMLKAAVLHCPVIGGVVVSDNREELLALDGIVKIMTIDSGVAVIAQQYWQAKNAVSLLKAEWQLPELSTQSSAAIKQDLTMALEQDGEEHILEGQGHAAVAAASKQITADYYVPYMAHATMEPMNCAAHISDGKIDVWTGTQSPSLAQAIASFVSGIDTDNIRIHTPWLGGGFGRRLDNDFVAEAVQIAMHLEQPVHLVWSREDDTRNDFYRPVSMARMSASVNDNGELHAWSVKRAGPNVLPYSAESALRSMLPGFVPSAMNDWLSRSPHSVFANWIVDMTSVDGLDGEYTVEHREVRHVTIDPGLRLGSLRAVGSSYSGFFKESFIDELAHHASQDPLEFRLRNSPEDSRFKGVVERLASVCDWQGGVGEGGRFRGVAAHLSFDTYVAQMVELSVDEQGIHVHRVVCVVDCGLVVNPDIVRAQMESAIVYGLSMALLGEITLEQGAVQQSNFHDYPVLRMSECPNIDVHIIESAESPTGVGEPGLPPIAAAVGNAIFAATGQRLRSLPFRLS